MDPTIICTLTSFQSIVHNKTSQPKLRTNSTTSLTSTMASATTTPSGPAHCRELPCNRRPDRPSNQDPPSTGWTTKPRCCKREFLPPAQRLQVRWNGRPSKIQTISDNRRLCEHQELAICQYLDYLDNIGLPAHRLMITDCAMRLCDVTTQPTWMALRHR